MNAIIKHTIIGNLPRDITKPQLMLVGNWLEDIGFGFGTFVTITYTDECLILKSCGTDYHTLMENIEPSTSIICVTNRLKRKIPLLHLVLNGMNLTRYGFGIGMPVTVSATFGMIQVKSINLLSYEFCPKFIMKKKICHVHRAIHRGNILPKIQLTGTWLSDIGFAHENFVSVTYEPNLITFKATTISKDTISLIKQNCTNHKMVVTSTLPNGKLVIKLQGLWLETLGFSIKTPFFVHYTDGLIQITRLKI